jgi:hypothetical protein
VTPWRRRRAIDGGQETPGYDALRTTLSWTSLSPTSNITLSVHGSTANVGGSIIVVNEAVSVVEAHWRAGLPHELGGPLLKAVYDGEIPSEHDPAGGPVPWVRVADVETWASSRVS